MRFLYLSILLFSFHTLFSQCKINYSNYSLVLFEDFKNTSKEELSEDWQFVRCNTNDQNGNEFYKDEQSEIIDNDILRITAKRVDPYWIDKNGDGVIEEDNEIDREITYESGLIMTKCGNGQGGSWPIVHGYSHGIFEIRAKLPPTRNWSAFWIYNGNTEIDIFEASDEYIFSSNLHNNADNSDSGTCQIFHKSDVDLSKDFHTFTVMWNEFKVTYFIDGREFRTVYSEQIKTWDSKAFILIDLAMRSWYNAEIAHLDIDYIKVWQALDNDYTKPYKNNKSNMHNNITLDQEDPNVKCGIENILPLTSSSNVVYFAGEDSKLYKAIDNGSWEVSLIDYTYDENSEILGELDYLPSRNYILYVGNDNRIQFYSLNNNYHYWIDNNWSDYNSFEEVKSANGCLDVDSNSNIFYIAKDNQIYYYRFNGKTWDLNKIVLSKGEYSAYNDLTIDKIGNLIFKDEIGRIFVIWKTSGYKKITNSYTPTNTNTCSLDGGSIVLTNDLICFKNNDKLSYIDWTNPYFPIDDLVIEHTNLFNYGNSGFVDGRKINGNLHYQKENQRIIYSGYDGRLQAIYNIENNDFSHYWIDNHWLTNDFKMSNVNDSNQCSPSITSSESTKAYYVNHDRTLDNFKWDLCEIQPECSEDSNDLLALRFKKNAEINRLSFKVVPNPVQFDLLKLSFEGEFHPKPSIVKIFNINGQTLKTIELNLQNEIALDISDLKKGTYLVMIINEDKLETKLFVK